MDRAPGRDLHPAFVEKVEALLPWMFLCLGVATVSFGCHSGVRPPCDNPPPFYVILEASPRLNPDDAGEPLTVTVEVIQLKGIAQLPNAGFFDVWRQAKETFKEDFLQSKELSLDPGGKTTQGLQRDVKANYVLVMGAFRKPHTDSWRSIAQLPPVDPEKCTPQPAPIMQAPATSDTQLRFFLQNYTIENRTPSERKSNLLRPGNGALT